jgi:serine/threonine protein kinase
MSAESVQIPPKFEEKKDLPEEKSEARRSFPSRLVGYKEVRKLGNGTFGNVFEVRVKGDLSKKTYALKVQDSTFTINDEGKQQKGEGLSKTGLVEVDFMKRFSHPCLHSILHAFSDSGKVCFVSEKAEHHLNSSSLIFPYTREEIVTFIHQLFSALEFIHSTDQIHCDVKGLNCLIFGIPGKRIMKLCDFGVVQRFQKDRLIDKVQATPHRAPEVFRKEAYGRPSDIWAAGMLLFDLIFGFDAAAKMSEEETYAFLERLQSADSERDIFTLVIEKLSQERQERIVGNARYQLKLLGDDYEKIRNLIRMCVVFDPEKRITASQALTLPLFTEVKLPAYKGEIRKFGPMFDLDSWKVFSPFMHLKGIENFPSTTIALALDLFDRLSQYRVRSKDGVEKSSSVDNRQMVTVIACFMVSSKVSADFSYSKIDLEMLIGIFTKPDDVSTLIIQVLAEEPKIAEDLDFILQPDTLVTETWPKHEEALNFLKTLDKQTPEDIERFRSRRYKEISTLKV